MVSNPPKPQVSHEQLPCSEPTPRPNHATTETIHTLLTNPLNTFESVWTSMAMSIPPLKTLSKPLESPAQTNLPPRSPRGLQGHFRANLSPSTTLRPKRLGSTPPRPENIVLSPCPPSLKLSWKNMGR